MGTARMDAASEAAAVGRGAACLAGVGAALGGVAGTVDWPVVGTFFGVAAGAVLGVCAGVADGAALGLLGGSGRWTARVVSTAVASLAALGAARLDRGGVDVPVAVAAVLLVLGVLAAGAFGPMIAVGAEAAPGPAQPMPDGQRAARDPGRLAARGIATGAGTGACIGSVAGFVVGARTYLPTSPFAAVEGAAFGSAAGVMLACLALAVVAVSKVRTRR